MDAVTREKKITLNNDSQKSRSGVGLLILVLALMVVAVAMMGLLYTVSKARETRMDSIERDLALMQQDMDARQAAELADEIVEPAETPLPAGELYACVSHTQAKIYQYPEIASAVIGRPAYGEELEVIGEEGRFFTVKLDEKNVGYVEKRIMFKDGNFCHVPGAVDLRALIPTCEFDMLFASENNITGHAMYPAVPILEENTAYMLLEASKIFEADGYYIRLCDAYRPRSAQFELYEIVKDNRFIANPNNGGFSWHNKGRAVDISLISIETGEELEMPTPMHTFAVTASRGYAGNWSAEAKANVEYMTRVMTSVGFGTLSTEWWHYENTRAGGYLDMNLDLSDPIYYTGS